MTDTHAPTGSQVTDNGHQGPAGAELLARMLAELVAIRAAVELGTQAAAATATALHRLVTSKRVAKWLGE